MQKLKTQLISKISIIIMVFAFLSPSVVKLIDAFQVHSYEICKTPQTHFHKQSLNCELCKINFSHTLDFQTQIQPVTCITKIAPFIDYYKKRLYNLKRNQTYLRGPPQLI